jgi:hypothetical protein
MFTGFLLSPRTLGSSWKEAEAMKVLARSVRLSRDPVLLLLTCLCASTNTCFGEQYDSKNRRDPFLRHKVARPSDTPIERRASIESSGLQGLLIGEVTLTGTAAIGNRFLAILKGKEPFSYIVSDGTELSDGYITEISERQVVFTRVESNRKGQLRTSRLTRKLGPLRK